MKAKLPTLILPHVFTEKFYADNKNKYLFLYEDNLKRKGDNWMRYKDYTVPVYTKFLPCKSSAAYAYDNNPILFILEDELRLTLDRLNTFSMAGRDLVIVPLDFLNNSDSNLSVNAPKFQADIKRQLSAYIYPEIQYKLAV